MYLANSPERPGQALSARFAAWSLFGLLVLHFALRYWLIQCPSLLNLNYDEAVIGLMTMEAFQGHFPALVWGQAYMGPLEAYFALPLTAVAGVSALSMRLSQIILDSIILLMVYFAGRHCLGRRAGLMAALYWALPPLFLGFFSIHVSGGHLASIAGASIFLLVACRLAKPDPPPRAWLWALAGGLAAGLGFWASLLCAPLLFGAGLAMLLVRPGMLLKTWPYLTGLGFFAGSAPFWLWNLRHSWLTFQQVGGGGGSLWANLQNLFSRVWLPSLTGGWWDGASIASEIPGYVHGGVLLLVYIPLAAFVLWGMARWIGRIVKGRWPFQSPLDIAVICLLAALLFHINSSYGSQVIMRYAAAAYLPFAVVMGAFLAKLWRRSLYAWALIVVLLVGYNLGTYIIYRQEHQNMPPGGIENLLASLKEDQVTHAYSHARISLPITFESGMDIKASDYFGLRNLELLDQVGQAESPAIITSHEFGNPMPKDMQKALDNLGAPYQKGGAGSYIYWFNFAPEPKLTPVPGSELQTSLNGTRGPGMLLFDRNPLTTLYLEGKDNAVLEIDLARARDICRISLLPDVEWPARPGMFIPLRVEGSRDGEDWHMLSPGTSTYMAGLIWQRSQVRLESIPSLQINFAPQKLKKIRITLPRLHKWGLKFGWELSELYVYEARDPGDFPPNSARQTLAQAQAELKAWYHNPKGPNSSAYEEFVSYRRSVVDWVQAVEHLQQTLCQSPEWEEPMHHLVEAYGRGNLEERGIYPIWDAMVLEQNYHWRQIRPDSLDGLLISGDGEIKLGMMPWGETLEIDPQRPLVMSLEPGDDPQSLQSLEGGLLVTRLQGRAELASAYLHAGSRQAASELAGKVLEGDRLDPAAGLKLASQLARAGMKPLASRLLEKLEHQSARRLSCLMASLASGEEVSLEEQEYWLGLGCNHLWPQGPVIEAERSGYRFGVVEMDAQAMRFKAVSGRPGKHKPGELKVWFRPYFKKGRYLVNFRLKGGPGVKLRVHWHQNHRYMGLLREENWDAGSSEYVKVTLPVQLTSHLSKLEAGVAWDGDHEVRVDRIWVEPDRDHMLKELVEPLQGLLKPAPEV